MTYCSYLYDPKSKILKLFLKTFSCYQEKMQVIVQITVLIVM